MSKVLAGTSYQFRVSAENLIGIGEVSDIAQYVTDKGIFVCLLVGLFVCLLHEIHLNMIMLIFELDKITIQYKYSSYRELNNHLL